MEFTFKFQAEKRVLNKPILDLAACKLLDNGGAGLAVQCNVGLLLEVIHQLQGHLHMHIDTHTPLYCTYRYIYLYYTAKHQLKHPRLLQHPIIHSFVMDQEDAAFDRRYFGNAALNDTSDGARCAHPLRGFFLVLRWHGIYCMQQTCQNKIKSFKEDIQTPIQYINNKFNPFNQYKDRSGTCLSRETGMFRTPA